jgi:hypothetical protein
MVYLSIIKCLLSRSTQASTAAVLFDMDNTFDIERFSSLTQSVIESSGDALGTVNVTGDPSSILDECLQRLIVFRPKTTAQLAADLIGLPTYMQSPSMAHWKLSLIVVDPLNGLNYWVDRRSVEERRAGGDRTAAHPSRPVLRALQCLQAEHAVSIMITTWKLSPAAQQGQYQWPQTQTPTGLTVHPGTYARSQLGRAIDSRVMQMLLPPISVEMLDIHQSLDQLLLSHKSPTNSPGDIQHITTIRPVLTSAESKLDGSATIQFSNIGVTVQ